MILEKYSNINSAAGDEEEIRKSILDDIKKYVDKYEISPIGNLVAFKKGKKNKTTLLTAHMDEVALIVKSIKENGLINFYPVGGFIPKILLANNVIIGKKRINGVIAYKSYHLMSESERKNFPDIKDLFIDIGAIKKDEITDIKPGDYIYFKTKFFKQGNYFFGKAFDDRAGCANITNILQQVKQPYYSILAVYTVQEEVGLRGGATAAYHADNEIVFNLNLEGTTCSDRELKNTYSPSTTMGEGPAITIMDRTSIVNKKLFEFVKSIAEKNNIPFQLKRSVTGGTDAGRIHLTKEGIPSITISVPVRYIHSPWGIMYKKDFDNYLKLAKLVVENAKEFSL